MAIANAHESVDITKASLNQIGNNIKFTMELSGNPIHQGGCYKFLIDEDMDPSTGHPRSTLGVDYFIVICNGNLSIFNAAPGYDGVSLNDKLLNYENIGNRIEMTIDTSFLKDNNEFKWGAECFNDNGYDITGEFGTYYLKKDKIDVTFSTIPEGLYV